MSYRETNDARFLDHGAQHRGLLHGRMPADGVPYFDFDAPATDRPRDASAAAIAASGLLWLARHRARRVPRADLPRRGQADPDLALGAAVSLARARAGAASILLHATAQHQQGDVDNGLVYADYYFLEALLRYRDIASGATPLGAPTCVVARRCSSVVALDAVLRRHAGRTPARRLRR